MVCLIFSITSKTLQVLGEAMAGISQHCKTGDVVAFGDSVGVASKALCGLTEAAGQVRSQHGHNSLSYSLLLLCFFKSTWPSALYIHLNEFTLHRLVASHSSQGAEVLKSECRTDDRWSEHMLGLKWSGTGGEFIWARGRENNKRQVQDIWVRIATTDRTLKVTQNETKTTGTYFFSKYGIQVVIVVQDLDQSHAKLYSN